jgi:chemotaxis protein MotB
VSDGGHGGGGGGKKHRGHEEEHEEHENHERWLVSYADMMTLLMVLFIVMFAISQVDQKKFMMLKTGLSVGFGAPTSFVTGGDHLLDVGGAVAPDSVNLAGTPGGPSKSNQINPNATPGAKSATLPTEGQVAALANATARASVAKEVKTLQQAQKDLQKALTKAGFAKGATFRFDERGLVVTVATDKVLFDSGSATLRPEGRRILDALTPTLAKLPNNLSIDGHTNAVPISTAMFPTNWELAADRATGVLRYLTHAIKPARMSAAAFADTRPLKSAADPVSVSVNRRVEIVVLANIDNSAGRAVAQLGNTPAKDAAGGSATITSSSSGSAEDLWATPSPSPSPNPSAASDWAADPPASPKAATAAADDPWPSPSPDAGSSDWLAEPSPKAK